VQRNAHFTGISALRCELTACQQNRTQPVFKWDGEHRVSIMSKLTNARIAAAVNGGTAAWLSDGGSLYFKTNGKGQASWVFHFRNGSGRSSAGLGSFPAVTVMQARAARDAERVAVRQRRASPAATPLIGVPCGPEGMPSGAPTLPVGETLADAVRVYLVNHAAEWSEKGALENRQRMVEMHCAALLKRPLASITRDEIAAVLRQNWKGPSVGLGCKLMGLLNKVFSSHGLQTAAWKGNLEHVLSRANTKTNHHPSLPWQDTPAAFQALGACSGNAATVARVAQWCILTGCRSEEACQMQWSELTQGHALGLDMWTKPDAQTKTRQAHQVPLTGAMIALLPPRKPDGFVFLASNTATGKVNAGSVLKLIKKLCPGVEVSTHGFRSTIYVWAAEHDLDDTLVDGVLAHASGDRTKDAYKRTQMLKQRRQFLDAWSAYVAYSNFTTLAHVA